MHFSHPRRYRHQLISQIPRLTVLDGVDVTEDEIERVRALLQQGDGPEDITSITASAPLMEREGRTRKQVGHWPSPTGFTAIFLLISVP